MPDLEGHPDEEEMEIGAIFSALADPCRRQVVQVLASAGPDGARSCSAFDLPVTKATRTHHFRVLREAGLIRQQNLGNSRSNRLRWAELERRFPGLIDLVLGTGRCETAQVAPDQAEL